MSEPPWCVAIYDSKTKQRKTPTWEKLGRVVGCRCQQRRISDDSAGGAEGGSGGLSPCRATENAAWIGVRPSKGCRLVSTCHSTIPESGHARLSKDYVSTYFFQ